MIRPAAITALILLLSCVGISQGEKLPSSIRGYKVHSIKSQVKSGGGQSPTRDAVLSIGTPSIVDASLSGLTLEATAEIQGIEQDGDIDFLTFKDMQANGIPLDIEEYQHPFKLKKGESLALPVPVRALISSLNLAKAAYKESTTSPANWQITGTVFVFGRFKKMGMTFKRVIPVPITLTIPDPVRPLTAAAKPQ